MSRKQDTPSRKPDASRHRTGRYTLSESELTSLEACEKLKNDLESDGAKNLKVYVGTWGPADKLGRRIVREEGSKVLCNHDAPRDLLEWLKARRAQRPTAPVVIEAALPPLVESPKQKPPDYQEEMERAHALPNDVAGHLRFDRAWPLVKELAEAEKWLPYTDKPVELRERREKLLKILWEDYPATAERVRAPNPSASDQQVRPAAISAGPKGFDGLGKKKKGDFSEYLDGLAEQQRICLSMKFEYELPIAEIARRLDLHRKTVQEHIAAGMNRLNRNEEWKKRAKRRAFHGGSQDE